MNLSHPGVKQAVSLVLVFLLLFASLLWVSHVMSMQQDGTMEGCFLAGGRVMLCALSAAAQVGIWQVIFTAVLPAGIIIIVLNRVQFRGSVLRQYVLAGNFAVAFQRFRDQFWHWLLLDPLRYAFSRGIIHAKIYE